MQTSFYAGGLSVVVTPPADEHCLICTEDYTSHLAVSIDACGHIFHRHCIIMWFQELYLNYSDERQWATCPHCRYRVFPMHGLSHSENLQNNWTQILFSLMGTPFETVAREGLMDALEPSMSALIRWCLERMVHIDADSPLLEDLMRLFDPCFHRQLGLGGDLVPTTRYSVNVGTDPYDVVNQAIRGDLVRLSLIVQEDVEGYASTLDSSVDPDWIALIDDILGHYLTSSHPHANYVTYPLLQRLTVAAALYYRLGQSEEWNQTYGFYELLAHADNLLMYAQQTARRMSEPGVEFRRLLGRPDDWQISVDQPDNYPGNCDRIMWIVNLRWSARGRNVDPYGPEFRQA